MKDYFADEQPKYNEHEEEFIYDFKNICMQVFGAFFNFAKNSETIEPDDFFKYIIEAVDEILIEKNIDPYRIAQNDGFSFTEELMMQYLSGRIQQEKPDINFDE